MAYQSHLPPDVRAALAADDARRAHGVPDHTQPPMPLPPTYEMLSAENHTLREQIQRLHAENQELHRRIQHLQTEKRRSDHEAAVYHKEVLQLRESLAKLHGQRGGRRTRTRRRLRRT